MLALLVVYAVVAQTLEKRRQQRLRLIAALKQRQRHFSYMATGFPPGFLTRDLSTLAFQTLLEICEQLARLEPRNSRHKEDVELCREQMAAARKAEPAAPGRLENPGLAVDIRRHLQELQRHVVQQQQRGTISAPQALLYRQQIHRLVVQVSLDSYLLEAKAAHKAEKPRLELHYYTLAHNLLTRENAGGAYSAQLDQLAQTMARLQQQLQSGAETPKAPTEPKETEEEAQKAWEKFSEGNQLWKKKQIYD